MLLIAEDPLVLNFVHSKKTNDRFHGSSFCQILTDGLSTMEGISNQTLDFQDTLCEQFPRLWFLSDREVMQLLSLCPTPFTLQPFVRKCFEGVCCLEVDCEIKSNARKVESSRAESQSLGQMEVLGVFGSLQEHIAFPSPLKPNLNALFWLCVFEQQLKLTMVQLMKQCVVVRNQHEPSGQDLASDNSAEDILHHIAERRNISLPALDMLSEYPLQCLLVAEETVWCKVILHASQESSSVKLNNLKAYNSVKLKKLVHFIRQGVTEAEHESSLSKYKMMCLRALVQNTMNHAQQLSQLLQVPCLPLESSFEWLSLMKYYINSEECSLEGSDDSKCFVDVLGHRLQYDYEYFGPEDWLMVHTPSTDRAILGIVLALTSYRCGFVSGPCMSGKKTTVVQLGKALGRQVISIQCCSGMRLRVVQRMLLGALQTGAWLLLESVDLLPQGLLSLLGQHLVDIHQSFSRFKGSRNQTVDVGPQDVTANRVRDGQNIGESECHMIFAGKTISASLSYGCVLTSSKGFTSVVPESLRCATRPIALTYPDYRIYAEVMLTSIGFSDAMSLSRHLVSLISQAKDSLCLPDFITKDQSCYLIVLQKIISASEMHLQQNVRQREILDEAEGLAPEQTDRTSSQSLTPRAAKKDRKETERSSRLHGSHLSIIQGLMEETAVVKAILSVVLPVCYEQKKALQFYNIFKETFPVVCQFPFFQQYIEGEEKSLLKDAVTEELQRKWFHADTEIIENALTLYQTMKFAKAVMLLGPSGSGKTACYCAVAGALNQLAVRLSASAWNSVETVVLFPNSMSHEELFGCCCEKRGWQDGAVASVLRGSEQCESSGHTICNKKGYLTPRVKWLVMDGDPAGQPGWLDHLTTLCSPEDPFLCLASGETLTSQSHLKLLLEVTDIRDASPSAVTRCSLIYFRGADLWKSVWKSEMDALSFEHKLDRETLKVWNRLAEDLFSNTLSWLRREALTSAIHGGESSRSVVHGLQEILSFFRILRALLQHFKKEVEKTSAEPQVDERGKTITHGHLIL